MADFSPVFGSGGLVVNQRVTSAQLNQLDADHVNSLNKTGGTITGTILVTSTGTIGFASGSNLTLQSGSNFNVDTAINIGSGGGTIVSSGGLNLIGAPLSLNSSTSITLSASGAVVVAANQLTVSNNLLVNNNATITGILTATQTVINGSGTALYVNNNATVAGTLTAGVMVCGGTLTVNSGMSVTSNATIGGLLAVGGNFSAGNTVISGTFNTEAAVYQTAFTTVSGPTTYNLSTTDSLIQCNTAAGAVTLNLPAASSNSGRIIRICDTGNAGTNPITVAAAGSDKVFGLSSFQLASNYDGVAIWCNGSAWLSYGFNT